ncbi:MAG: 2-hydroxyacid dehydrogenase [Caldilineaceae bacterium]
MPKAIFFTNLVPELAGQIVAPAPAGWDVQVHSAKLPVAEKANLIADADFLILFPSLLELEVLNAARNLKLIQLVSAGFDQMPMDAIAARGIPVANNGGTNSIDVAEHTLALMLGVYRLMPQMDRNVRNDGWKAIDSGLHTFTIHGKTVGIIGLGHIGRQVAQRLAPFGAKLIYYDPFPAKPEVEEALGVERCTLDDLLRRADIVTLHVPLNDQTRHIIDARALSLMKPTAVVINTCRGPVIDEPALTAALREGRIRAAGLDVLDKEPPTADNPILQLENVLFSPHSAGVTYDTWQRRGAFIFENLQRVESGEKPLAVIG